MTSDVGVATQGLLHILIWGAIIGGIGIPMVVASMITKSWLPIVIGMGSTISLSVWWKQKHENKKIQADKKSFPMSKELQDQRFEAYLKSIHKDSE